MLFQIVYEKVSVSEKNFQPHLWTFRSRITLEHLTRLLRQKRIRENHMLLFEFMQVVGVFVIIFYHLKLSRIGTVSFTGA